jgi:2-polyprenyl-3-methyl-5-hydroxy-6-metoxy-1,4-benzoquinol methylase
MDPRLHRHPLGFWQVRDIPTADELSAYYAERYYQQEKSNYRRSYPPDELDWMRIKLVQKHAAVTSLIGQRSGSMLDVGCGEGFAMAFFQNEGWTVSGMDYSDEGLLTMNPDLRPFLRTGDVFQLLDEAIASNEHYDLVWLGNVLEHVTDPVGLLNALNKLVASDGLLVVTVPNDGTRLHEQLFESAQIPERFWIAIPDHISYFDASSLRQATEACGWSCTRIIADFPIDWFLTHAGSNYVADRSQGPAAHRARIALDRLMGDSHPDIVNAFYEHMAAMGLGRQITAYLRPKSTP